MVIVTEWEYMPINIFIIMYMVYSNKLCLSKDLIKNSIQNLSEIPESDIQPGTPCSDLVPKRNYSCLSLAKHKEVES